MCMQGNAGQPAVLNTSAASFASMNSEQLVMMLNQHVSRAQPLTLLTSCTSCYIIRLEWQEQPVPADASEQPVNYVHCEPIALEVHAAQHSQSYVALQTSYTN